MRPFTIIGAVAMNEKRILIAVGALSASLAACSSEITPSDGMGTTGGAAATPPNGSGGTVPGAGGATAKGGAAPVGSSGSPSTTTGGSSSNGGNGSATTCTPGIPATTQIPRLLNRQYDAVVRELLGVSVVPGDNKPPSGLLFQDFDGPMNPDAWRLYQEVGAKIAADVMAGPNKAKFISCDPAAADCLKNTIMTFGRKAFRRPLTDAEVARFEKLSQTTPAGTPAEVAEATLLAFLVSPSFLQIPELTTEVEGSAIKLSSYEVAARLSFLLWGSVPDDVLNAAADAGQLTTKEQILDQAKRMILVREKTAPLVAGFHRRWLDMDNSLSHWWKVQHDKTIYPLYNEASLPASQAELDKFFEDVAFGGGSFKDLFLSNVGYVNKDTAAIYGLDPANYGADLARVELDPAQRPGFLTRAGFLSSYSSFGSTSPILRGAFITVNMIGVNPGPPLPEATQVPAPPGTYLTQKAYVEALTSQASCTGCHTPFINPPGFVLERYDAIGKWQTVDPRGGPIETTPVNVTVAPGDVRPISSPLELMDALGKGPLARRIYAQKWVSFAYGRQKNPNDDCVVDLLDTRLSTDGYTVLDLLGELTQTDSFRLRVREN
jgi:hypothetical protein